MYIDSIEVRIGKKRLVVFISIDRATRFVWAEVFERKTIQNSETFLKDALKVYPFKVQKVLTDNGSEFTYKLLLKKLRPKNKLHKFDQVCEKNELEHRLTKFRHPWTNGMVERFNRIFKEATTKKFHYNKPEEFVRHLQYFILEFNFAKKLKTLQNKTPFEKMLEYFQNEPNLFLENPNHKIWGANN